ncbi:hypothetical protein V8B97DRAFT_1876518 [Scleroderma yunnanense]
MLRAKTNCSKLKIIRCPRCGRKFCSETNILQHMNQPTSSCHAIWHEQHTHPLHHFSESHLFTAEHGWVLPDNPVHNHNSLGTFNTVCDLLDPDVEIDDNEGEVPQGRFIETYEGCSKTFLGGKTFMDTFREDTYAHERAENLYFPFALHEEWQFTSWLLCSRLSLMAINSLLLLKIVSQPCCSCFYIH